MKKKVVILGATGSIGESARKVARDIPDRMEIVGMSAHSNAAGLAKAAQEFPNAKTVLSGEPGGAEKLVELATLPDADMVIIAIIGTGGLAPALAAIEAGKDIAVASKEILVMAGEIVMAAATRSGSKVLPVDSEHNAIFQCLDGKGVAGLSRLILTCSGGPFRKSPLPRNRHSHSRDGAQASDLVDGPQNHHRLRHPLQQGPGNDRGPLALRCPDAAG